MIQFLRKYRQLFFVVFPIMMVSGVAFSLFALPVALGAAMYFAAKRKHDHLILLFLVILTLGDSRVSYFQWVKNVRVELLLFLAIMTFRQIKSGMYGFSRDYLLFIPFTLLAMVSMIDGYTLGTAFLKNISYALLLFVSLHYFKEYILDNGDRLLHDVVYLSILVLGLSFIFIFINPSLVFYLGGARYNALLGNPNGLGVYVTLMVPLHYLYYQRNPQVSRRFKAIVWGLLFFSLIFCASRNALFSVAIFLVLSTAFRYSLMMRLFFLLGVFPAIFLLIFYIPWEQVVIGLGLEDYFRTEEFTSGSGRVFAWMYALEQIQIRPLLGCGFACDEFIFLRMPSFELFSSGHQGGIHNTYLSMLVNVGFFGILLFFSFWVNLLRKLGMRSFLLPFIAMTLFSITFESWMMSSLNSFTIFFILTVLFVMVFSSETVTEEAQASPPPSSSQPEFAFG